MESANSFDDIIEYDAGCSSDKENENFDSIRQPKTTKDQFKTMDLFMNEHDEKHIDKDTYTSLWENLAAKLNDIGPPDHTTSEWRRIWSVHKYNKKRKRLVDSDSEEPEQIDHLVSPARPAVEKCTQEFSNKIDIIIGNQSFLSEKIDVVIGNQNRIIENQKSMINELQSSNKFLQDIAKKA